MTAAMTNGNIYSSNDFGATWTKSYTIGYPTNKGITATSNLQRQIYLAANGNIYLSGDYGKTFKVTYPSDAYKTISAITMDPTGKYLIAGATNEFLYFSTDYGVTWTESNSQYGSWNGGVLSSYGHSTFITSSGYISTSSDYGKTWTQGELKASWSHIVGDSSAKYLTANANANGIYSSADYGATWEKVGAYTDNGWGSLATSTSASHLVAGGSYGRLYVCTSSSTSE